MKDKLLAARQRAKNRGQDPWPISQKLTDVLRCTLDCSTPQVLLQTWERLKSTFQLKEGNGGLQNKFLGKDEKPLNKLTKSDFPNLHAQPIFVSANHNYKLVVEIQIHLRDIFKLKDTLHVPYDITRTKDASELGHYAYR